MERVFTVVFTFDAERRLATDDLHKLNYAITQDLISVQWPQHSADGLEIALVAALGRATIPGHISKDPVKVHWPPGHADIRAISEQIS